ncbi:glucan endo-1,3-beta-glucosidase 14-like [Hordeum vulgare]|nr:glucan endo-1,3-beta-glucosidase 14-like [Hordeum vulgare]
MYAAIQALGHTDVDMKISKTGWPSRGDPDEAGATPFFQDTWAWDRSVTIRNSYLDVDLHSCFVASSRTKKSEEA